MPAEAVFAEINAYHPDLLKYSYERKVWICGPTTLMSTLSTIGMILKNIERENSVVFARNFWPYIVEDIPKLIDNLSKQLGRNSTLIIGGYDINGCGKIGIDLRNELIKKGFISLDDLLILEKF